MWLIPFHQTKTQKRYARFTTGFKAEPWVNFSEASEGLYKYVCKIKLGSPHIQLYLLAQPGRLSVMFDIFRELLSSYFPPEEKQICQN